AELDLARLAGRRRSGGVELGKRHERVAGIVPEDLECVRNFTIVVVGEFAADGDDRRWGFYPERAVDLAQIVDAEVGELPAGVGAEPAQPIEGAVMVVMRERRRAPPPVPTEPGRWVRVGRAADALGPLVLAVEGSDGRPLADPAGANKFGRLRRHRAGEP